MKRIIFSLLLSWDVLLLVTSFSLISTTPKRGTSTCSLKIHYSLGNSYLDSLQQTTTVGKQHAGDDDHDDDQFVDPYEVVLGPPSEPLPNLVNGLEMNGALSITNEDTTTDEKDEIVVENAPTFSVAGVADDSDDGFVDPYEFILGKMEDKQEDSSVIGLFQSLAVDDVSPSETQELTGQSTTLSGGLMHEEEEEEKEEVEGEQENFFFVDPYENILGVERKEETSSLQDIESEEETSPLQHVESEEETSSLQHAEREEGQREIIAPRKTKKKVTRGEPFWKKMDLSSLITNTFIPRHDYKTDPVAQRIMKTPKEKEEEKDVTINDEIDLAFRIGANVIQSTLDGTKVFGYAARAFIETLADGEVRDNLEDTKESIVDALQNRGKGGKDFAFVKSCGKVLESTTATLGSVVSCLSTLESTENALQSTSDMTRNVISAFVDTNLFGMRQIQKTKRYMDHKKAKEEEERAKKLIAEMEQLQRQKQMEEEEEKDRLRKDIFEKMDQRKIVKIGNFDSIQEPLGINSGTYSKL